MSRQIALRQRDDAPGDAEIECGEVPGRLARIDANHQHVRLAALPAGGGLGRFFNPRRRTFSTPRIRRTAGGLSRFSFDENGTVPFSHSRRVDEAKSGVVQVDLGGKVIPGRARLIGDEPPGAADQGVEEAALAAVRRAGEDHAEQFPADAAARPFVRSGRRSPRPAASSRGATARAEAAALFFGEVEVGLQVGRQVEQFVAKPMERPGQAAGQLHQGRESCPGRRRR